MAITKKTSAKKRAKPVQEIKLTIPAKGKRIRADSIGNPVMRDWFKRIDKLGFIMTPHYHHSLHETKFGCYVTTLGLTERGWPEVIMFGATEKDLKKAAAAIQQLVADWEKNGGPRLGKSNASAKLSKCDALLEVALLDNERIEQYANGIPMLYPRTDAVLVQAMWADHNGKYPTEAGYDQDQYPQPAL